MGINFYALDKHCRTCNQALPEGSEYTRIHLGKASVGWQFTLQYNDGKYYKNWLEMKGWLADKHIVNEYDDQLTLQDFIEWVENRQDIKDPITSYGHDDRLKIIGGYKFYNSDFS